MVKYFFSNVRKKLAIYSVIICLFVIGGGSILIIDGIQENARKISFRINLGNASNRIYITLQEYQNEKLLTKKIQEFSKNSTIRFEGTNDINYVSYKDGILDYDYFLTEGRFLDLKNNDEVVLGYKKAEKLIGGKQFLGREIMINGRKLKVVGILGNKLSKEFDANRIYVNINGFENIFENIDLSHVNMSVYDCELPPSNEVNNIIEVLSSVDRNLKVEESGVGENSEVLSIRPEQIIFIIILIFIIIIFAGINLAMYTFRNNKNEYKGLLVIGYGKKDIYKLLMIEGIFLGIISSILTVILFNFIKKDIFEFINKFEYFPHFGTDLKGNVMMASLNILMSTILASISIVGINIKEIKDI